MNDAVEKGTYKWESTFDRSWEEIEEEDGQLKQVEITLQRKRKKRLDSLHVNSTVHRGMLRFTILVLDLTKAVKEIDMSPSRYAVMINVVEVRIKTNRTLSIPRLLTIL